jgi:drug/metabolite transporter (DMT)-like permease
LQQLRSAGPAVWLSLVAIAVFSLTIAMMLFFWVIKRINLTQASLSIYLLPVFGVLISTVALKEKITGRLLLGGVLVFVATFLATTHAERKSLGKITSRSPDASPIRVNQMGG